MNTLHRFAAFLLVVASPLGAFGQGTISTYLGPSMPVSGTMAVSQTFDAPGSVTPDGSGGFYFSDFRQSRVYRVTAAGVLTVVAGNGTAGYSGDGGPATAAGLDFPSRYFHGSSGVALDSGGNLYIADPGSHRIRKVTAGIITTVAGDGRELTGGFGDGGAATSASLVSPNGVAVDSAGNLYIADLGDHRVRKVTPAGVITTVAGFFANGYGGDGGTATAAMLNFPTGVAVDNAGNLYISDTANYRIRKVTPAGVITTVAGTGTFGYGGDGGAATSTSLAVPTGLALDSAGNLYIADDSRIRKVTPAGAISTVAGRASGGYAGDGGAATSASLLQTAGVAVDSTGNIFIADTGNSRIRKVTPAGVITTAAGNETIGYRGSLGSPNGIAVDSAGNLYVPDPSFYRVLKVTPAGLTTIFAGSGVEGYGGDGGAATSALLQGPAGLAFDSVGNLYIADRDRIRKVTPAGIITTVAGNGIPGFGGDGGAATAASFDGAIGVATDSADNLYIADAGNYRIRKMTAAGIITTVAGDGTPGFSGDWGGATFASLLTPYGVTVDSADNLYIVDGSRIRKVTPGGIITTVAGDGSQGYGGNGGPATEASLNFPTHVVVDSAGNLYIADTNNNRIRRVTAAGNITTIAGNGRPGYGGDGGTAVSASLFGPNGLAVDRAGNLYIADTLNRRIRRVALTPSSIQSSVPFLTNDRGGMSATTSGSDPVTSIGFAAIMPEAGQTTPSGIAIFGRRENNILVSEASVPATSLYQSVRIYAEISGSVNTGLAIANPNNTPATLTFYFTGPNGDFGHSTAQIPANEQLARLLNQDPYNGGTLAGGTLTLNSSVPVSIVALRTLVNERSEFLMTTLPVTDLTVPGTSGTVVFPEFADGDGWTTQVILVNPTDTTLIGTVNFIAPEPVTITNGQSGNYFPYSIPPRSSQTLRTSGAGSTTNVGWVLAVPSNNTTVPSGLVLFSMRNNGVTVTEAGALSGPQGTAFRIYAETRGTFGAPGSIQSGIALANPTNAPATVTLELSYLDGSSTGLTGTINLAPSQQKQTFLSQIPEFASLPLSFQGILRVSSPTSLSAIGVRSRYNERGDFLITTTPPVNEASVFTSAPLFFPQIADSGGYTTQFIVFSGRPGQLSTGRLQLFTPSGEPLALPFQ